MKDEIVMHSLLNQCENILKLFRLYEDETSMYLVLEYQSGGSLMDLIKKKHNWQEKDLRTIMA